ncbi:hypothetical protein FQN50_004724 [Emmonsiellopsis sp. PD_5]|nr:hypothetical protein FQN50_004724 [Emmonsiellopsis sp. PD_5]
MEIATDFAAYQEQVQAALIKATRTTGQISSEDLSFHRSLDVDISDSLDEQSTRLLSLTNSILKVATSGSDLEVRELQDEDGVEENWRAVVDVIDELLEKADACLDEFTGIIKKLSPSQEERGLTLGKKAPNSQFPSVYDFGPSKISKPQLLFTSPPDNNDPAPFKPLLRSKPHAIKPLSTSLGDRATSYNHPYEVEIRNSGYPSSAYSISTPAKFKPFETTTATFVDTLEGVHSMLAELKAAKEIAIDLEHHDAHSYHGIVCLMQISTRDKDWIVDTLKPWREELQVLNEVFADPSILKVLHGSTMDIIWLQRDLGLYIVGLFDTYHASVALNYPKKSLKYLLEKFVNFQAEKQYQMADWRLRPLLPGMFDYARSDTHYLLYIYDHLRNELLEHSTPNESLVDYVLEKSKEEALQQYERPVYNEATGEGPGGWYDVLARNSSLFSREQFAVFRAVHQWRDKTARSEDEGVQYVLSKQPLFKIAHAMPLDPASLLRTVAPVSPIVRARASELIQVIKEAKIAGATGPDLIDALRPYSKRKTGDESGTQTPLKSPVSPTNDRPIAGRAEVSQFWGSAINKQPDPPVPVSHSLAATAEAFLLSLPLPSSLTKVSDRPIKPDYDSPAAPSPTPKPQEPAPKPSPANEVFTVKQFGAPKKRKISPTEAVAEEETASTIPLSDPLTMTDSTSGHSDNKAQSRRQKKKKQKTGSGLGQNNDASSPAPFDYSTAESVLHAKPTDPNAAYPPGRRQKRQFDPYAKAMDAPKGMRKAQKEIEGKSYTFRK